MYLIADDYYFTSSPLMHKPDICTINISDCTYKIMLMFIDILAIRATERLIVIGLLTIFSLLSDESLLLFKLRSSYGWGLITWSN